MVGILQVLRPLHDPRDRAAVWNLVILVLLIVLRPTSTATTRSTRTRSPWLVATVVQLLMVACRRCGGSTSAWRSRSTWHDPRVRQVFLLMLPVTIGLGIVNLDQLLNSVFGSLVSDQAPRAIDHAFRIYMLPQGIFSVAIADRPVPDAQPSGRARATADELRHSIGIGMRQINLTADPVGRAADRARDADHAARLPARRVQRALHPPGLGGAVLVRVQPAVRGPEPAADPDVLRAAAPVDPDQVSRRSNMVVDIIVSLALVQAAGHRRPGDRDRGRRTW